MKHVFFILALCLSPCVLSQATNTLLQYERFLIVLAHPDDETWLNGTLALLADHNKSYRVLYATSGGAGNDYSNRGLSGQELAKTRETECMLAHKKLGLNKPPIFLRHDDVHLHHHETNIKNNILQHIHSFQPDTIITFDKHGITGHKDHILMNKLVSQLQPKLFNTNIYQVVVSNSRAESLHKIAKRLDHPYRIKHGYPDDKVSTTVNVKKYTSNRVEAFEQYTSQFPIELQILWKSFVKHSFTEEFIVKSR